MRTNNKMPSSLLSCSAHAIKHRPKLLDVLLSAYQNHSALLLEMLQAQLYKMHVQVLFPSFFFLAFQSAHIIFFVLGFSNKGFILFLVECINKEYGIALRPAYYEVISHKGEVNVVKETINAEVSLILNRFELFNEPASELVVFDGSGQAERVLELPSQVAIFFVDGWIRFNRLREKFNIVDELRLYFMLGLIVPQITHHLLVHFIKHARILFYQIVPPNWKILMPLHFVSTAVVQCECRFHQSRIGNVVFQNLKNGLVFSDYLLDCLILFVPSSEQPTVINDPKDGLETSTWMQPSIYWVLLPFENLLNHLDIKRLLYFANLFLQQFYLIFFNIELSVGLVKGQTKFLYVFCRAEVQLSFLLDDALQAKVIVNFVILIDLIHSPRKCVHKYGFEGEVVAANESNHDCHLIALGQQHAFVSHPVFDQAHWQLVLLQVQRIFNIAEGNVIKQIFGDDRELVAEHNQTAPASLLLEHLTLMYVTAFREKVQNLLNVRPV